MTKMIDVERLREWIDSQRSFNEAQMKACEDAVTKFSGFDDWYDGDEIIQAVRNHTYYAGEQDQLDELLFFISKEVNNGEADNS